MDVRAGRQQYLRHLGMGTNRRHVKWGDLVLRGDRSGKEDMDKEKTKERRATGVGQGIKRYIQHNPGSKSNHSAREHARVVCVFF